MVSLKKIAQDIGVSTATVSNALTGKGRVSEEMVTRIKARASELGYRPSSAARALKTGQTRILGLVMPDLTNPLFPRIAQTLSIAADKQKLGILIADSRGSAHEQSEALKRLVERGVDGLLVVPQKGTTPDPMPVPVAVIGGPEGATLRPGGRLADLAPTVLALMGLPQPAEMTGESLLS